MFRAPFDSFFGDEHGLPGFVEQLLSEQSLQKTGFFDAQAVTRWSKAFRQMRPNSVRRLMIEMGLVGVLATQLWYHTFVDASLADLPSLASRPRALVGEPAA
jgi:asparagine synthase (glutamine-hydrolysing)